jgi:hypothetical protein
LKAYGLEAVSIREVDHVEIAQNSDCVCNLQKAENFGAAVRIGPDTTAQQRKIAMARNCTTDR